MAYMRMRRRYVRRPVYKRRRIVKRRYTRRRRSSLITGTATSTSYPGATNYRKRRVPLRVIKRRRLVASDAALHHRSVNGVTGAFNTPTSSNACGISFIQIIPDNPISGSALGAFWTINGGLIPRHGDSSADFGRGDLFIRGGKSVLVITNLSAQPSFSVGAPIRVRTWRARTKAFGAPGLLPLQGISASNASLKSGWDPSIPTQVPGTAITEDPYRLFSFWDEKTIQLETGQSFERTSFIPSQKVNQGAYFEENNYRDFWIISVQTLTSGTFAPYQWTVTSNLSFTGDRVS